MKKKPSTASSRNARRPKSITAETLSLVYKDILAIKIEERTTIQKIADQFYEVMRKYGIKQGTWIENGLGRAVANPEWSFALDALHKIIFNKVPLFFLFHNVPADLLAYGKQPKPVHQLVRTIQYRKGKKVSEKVTRVPGKSPEGSILEMAIRRGQNGRLSCHGKLVPRSKSAPLAEIRKNGHILSAKAYIGAKKKKARRK